MDIENLREQVVGERATEDAQKANVGQTNQAGRRARSLSIEALEAMCESVRDAAFEEGFSHGVAAVRGQTALRVRRAGEDGETAGATAALTGAILLIGEVQHSESYGSTPLGDVLQSLVDSRDRIRADGLHGEREMRSGVEDGPGSVGW